MNDVTQTELIQIGGAEPAGLAAAITLAKAGRRDESCDHVNCTCVWCRHGGHRIAATDKACGS